MKTWRVPLPEGIVAGMPGLALPTEIGRHHRSRQIAKIIAIGNFVY
jgi:hypothetical protein